MNELFYKNIFKRKSFHLFGTVKEKISPAELADILETWKTFTPLTADIRTDIKIVSPHDTTCKRGQEYCIMLYSEKKGNYLQNIGYLGEQLDLYLASKNIGALWFGIGKTEETSYNGLDFVIMIAIAKKPEKEFRKDMFKAKRKPLAEIWSGNEYSDIATIVRFAPSACNTQPWFVESRADKLEVYRYKKPGKRGIMPAERVTFYNRIDIGIFLLFLEVCMKHKGMTFERKLYTDQVGDCEKTPIATYFLSEATQS